METSRSHLGRCYIKEEKISEGSFGVILRVREAGTSQVLVAKVFEEEEWVSLSDDEDETTISPTALREISFMRLLMNYEAPCIATLLDFDFAIDDYFALVVYMPLYCGDLSDAISDERLCTQQRFKVGCDVLRALVFMHSCSPPIAHRDIKPENVLLDERCHGVLTDFGFACFTGEFKTPTPTKRRKGNKPNQGRSTSQSSVSHSGVMGTVTYIAPEVLKGAYPHPSADMWATGVMFTEMFDNERLDADTDEEAFKILKMKRTSLEDGFIIQRVIKSFLKENPIKRMKAWTALTSLCKAGLLPAENKLDVAPSFKTFVDRACSPQIEIMCKKLRAVVPDTFAAAEHYCRIAPDMDPRTLVIIAAKVHEHRPRSDESMLEDMNVEVDALEEAQEELLKRTRGCLLVQSLL